MGFFKKMFSSVGIGSAKVDTVLNGNEFAPGDTIEAEVRIKGGKVEQVIEEIYFSVHCHYIAEVESDEGEGHETRTAVLDKFKLGESLTIGPGQEEVIPVDIELPWDIPISVGNTKVWIQTGLDIARAVDPGDRDYIRVVPDDMLGTFFGALEDMGFQLDDAECEAVRPSFSNRLPFIQEFEFKPTHGDFRGRLDELEVVALHHGDRVELWLEIDRRARGFSGFVSERLGTDESKVHCEFFEEDLEDLAENLYNLIDEHC